MAHSTPSTAYSRDLGDELRRLRETCTKLNGVALAVRLGWDPSKVSNIEHGKARPSEIDLVQYLTMCGKDIDFFEDFKRRYRNAFEEYIVQVPGNLRTAAMAESTATTITSYDVADSARTCCKRRRTPRACSGPPEWWLEERIPDARADADGPSGDPAETRSAGLLVLHP